MPNLHTIFTKTVEKVLSLFLVFVFIIGGVNPGLIVPTAVQAASPGGTPDYFGTTPNYANSPLPETTGGGVPDLNARQGTLIQAPSGPQIYVTDYVNGAYQKRWIESLTTFYKFGFNLNDVYPVSNAELAVYASGNNVQAIDTQHPNGALLRAVQPNNVYYIDGGVKRYVTGPTAFLSNGFRWDRILVVSQAELDSYANGQDLNARPGTLLQASAGPQIYVTDYVGGAYQKRWIDSLTTFYKFGYNLGDVYPVSNAELAVYALGNNVLSTDTQHPNGALLRAVQPNNVYYIEGGNKRYVTGPTAFLSNGFRWDRILIVNQAELDLYPGSTVSVVAGTGVRKFVDSLPGLGAANANDLGQYIPVAIPDKTTYPGSDYYEISLVQYTEQMHKDLPATTLRGYMQTNTNDATVKKPNYLGPIIVANRDVPVRVKFTNNLPIGTGGDLFLPVDTSIMGAGTGPDGTTLYTENRATLHLHGGATPWISDGTPHQWITPAGENTPYPKGVSVSNVPDMPDPGPGSETFFYTNQQSARLMFYHDHSYGITRLNVYGGEAAGYILNDTVEQGLVNSGVIPAEQIPLIIQDKTFVPKTPQLTAEDPTWDTTKWGGYGNLWYPHVYMPNQNPAPGANGVNMMGRWDYGPWFWPVMTNATHMPVNGQPALPNVSAVPEAFMDTPVVNGTAYPFTQVTRKAYRFRILNASNDRSLNLQLYYAKSNAPMWNADGSLNDANAGEVPMVTAAPGTGLPANWPTDGRAGGVPSPLAIGPSMVQIGTEGGFLPAPAVIPNVPIGYEYNRRDITVLNVSQKALMLGPAERADVIIDFSQVPAGSKLVMYNDSPAPVPAFDPRYDYYTGDPDQTSTGGAPTTLPGYGPNTRTIMQFQVAGAAAAPFNLAALNSALPTAFTASQPAPIVPESAYNTVTGTTSPDTYSNIGDTSLSFTPTGTSSVGSVTVAAGGSGYTAAPAVTFTGGGGTGAIGVATVSGGAITGVTIVSGGSGYTSPPIIGLTGGGGTGALATVNVSSGAVTGVVMTNGGTGYITPLTVGLSGGGGTGGLATATVVGGKITAFTVISAGTGYTTAPTINITGGGGVGATATASVAGGALTGVSVVNGTGYTTAPTVVFSGGGGTGAAATATITNGSVTAVTLTNGGTGYTSVPLVGFTGGGGTGAAATASFMTTVPMQPKAIQELFELNYGRMNATLGVELPFTNFNTQTTIPLGYVDPLTESITASGSNGPVVLGDGTQIWKITHNGVDTHAIHFHLYNVQLINRVGWDGMVKPPNPNELGWKETILMNPLEDAIVALRPVMLNLPFKIPNSVRPLDPTMMVGMPMSVTDPTTGNQIIVNNDMTDFGWEYVWHCHLLGHEENDMMRPVEVEMAPRPTNLAGGGTAGAVAMTWTNPLTTLPLTFYTLQRSTDATFPASILTTSFHVTSPATGYTDTTAAGATTYYYRVRGENTIANSLWSNVATVITP